MGMRCIVSGHTMLKSEINTVTIFGVPFSAISEEDTVKRIRYAVCNDEPLWIATANVDFVMRARRNPAFQHLLSTGPSLVVPDGVPILWAARLQRAALPGRVNGTDLVWHCAKISAETQRPIALVGSSPNVAYWAAERLQRFAPGAKVIVIPTPDPLTATNSQSVVDCLQQIQAGMLLVGLGAQKQEEWINTYWPATQIPVAMGVGGSFDLVSGHLSRAPGWMQTNGLEWLYRLSQEPKRLWRRYLLDDAPFIWLCLRAALRRMSQ